MKKVLLIVTGSIAAIKIFELIDCLKLKGFDLGIILTQAAHQWVSKKALEDIYGFTVQSELEDFDAIKKNIQSSSISAIIITAASANFIKQLAYQDRPLTQLICNQFNRAVILAPAMNVMMWQHPATQRNIKKLIHDGFYLAGPAMGKMACGDEGYGRLLEPSFITHEVVNIIDKQIPAARFNSNHAIFLINSRLPTTTSFPHKKILLMIHDSHDIVYIYSLISQLRSSGWKVTCAVSDKAKQLLPPAGIATLSHNKVYHTHYQEDVQGMEHIRLSEMNDLLLIAPATQKSVTEMAQGSAHDFLGCIYLATKKPVFLIPALDPNQSPNPDDLMILNNDGVTIVDFDPPINAHKKPDIERWLKKFNRIIAAHEKCLTS